MVTAAHGHSQVQRSQQCVTDLSEGNRISNVGDDGEVGHRNSRSLDETDSGIGYFASVFRERMAFHRPVGPLLRYSQVGYKYGSTTESIRRRSTKKKRGTTSKNGRARYFHCRKHYELHGHP
ncbi:hypothetical protein EVAR_81757_1 [Eumeta japonica]|uniref:Uncharacterized protein n=1 Tax=Eumeta variegata TaxID=151549 RepID=A0A4C1UIV6_EUMVA|nr:hypothetical protein EVAR_81757_1 [Eumeta japonica]